MHGSVRKLRGEIPYVSAMTVLFIIMIIGANRISFHIDEAWLGEQSWFQYISGYVHSQFFEGMLYYEDAILVRHKLFIYVGSLFIRLMGLDIVSLRIISVFSALVLFVLIRIYNRWEEGGDNRNYIYTMMVLLTSPLFFRYSMLYRPEMLLAAIGFAVFLTAERSVNDNRNTYTILSGILAGTAVLVHLNGLMFIAAGAAVFCIRRRWGMMVLFIAVSCAVASIYAYDIIGNIQLFVYQFRYDPALEGKDFEVGSFIFKVLDEHKRYFRTPEIIFMSVLYVLSLLINIIKFNKFSLNRSLYVLVSVMVLGCIAQSNTIKYAIPVVPLFAVETGTALKNIQETYKTYVSPLPVAIGLIVFVMGVYGITQNVSLMKSNVRETIQTHHVISEALPRGAKVLAPMFFMFDEIGRHEIVSLYWAEKYSTDNGRKMEWDSILRFAQLHSAQYIILNQNYMDRIADYTAADNEFMRLTNYRVYQIKP